MRSVESTQGIQTLLDQCNAMREKCIKERVDEFAARFEEMRPLLDKLVDERRKQEQERRESQTRNPPFNVFYLTNVYKKKELGHTRFLKELLEPQGSHGQGGLFLSSLLSREPINLDSHLVQGCSWIVRQEKHTVGYGNLDLFVCCPPKKIILVFENKIDAPDRPDQIDRYSGWLLDQRFFDIPERRKVIYLTRTGHRPASVSPNNEDMVTCMSFRGDVASWLGEVGPKVASDYVRGVVLQYEQYIRRL